MSLKKHIKVLLCILSFLSFNAYSATNLNDINTDMVSLKKQCGASENCAESFFELIPWIWNTRIPDSNNPLLVNIGPGTFRIANPDTGYGMLFCNSGGHVTFRGAGRSTTTIVGPGVIFPLDLLNESTVVKIKNCEQLSFEDMTIKADLFTDAAAYAVGWEGEGNSTWNNVELIASYYPWVDKCSNSGTTSSHSWFSSTFTSNGTGVLNVAYRSDCGFSEIHGSNLIAIKSSVNSPWSLLGVEAGSKGQVALYGSQVRVIVPADANSNVVYNNPEAPSGPSSVPSYGHGGLLALNGGIIHMHGGIISVRHERNDVNSSVFGARAIGSGSMVHTPDTAFGMKASGTGVVERIMASDGGVVNAPFQWPAGSNPPDIISTDGSDTFVETDCNSSGQCTDVPANQRQPHMMIYNSNCLPSTQWFDSTMKLCRLN